MQVDADSLGDYLRRERELRHVSLQDISVVTKVQLKFLEALEHDDYEQLPPAPFVVGFLRAYAQHLSLEPDEIVAAYHARYRASESPCGHQLPVAYQVKRARPFQWKWLGVLIGLMLVVAGLMWQTLRRGQESSSMPADTRVAAERVLAKPREAARVVDAVPEQQYIPPTASTAVVSHVPETASGSPPPESQPESHIVATTAPHSLAPEPPPHVPPASTADPAPVQMPAKPLVLQVVAVQETWLRVDIDGETRLSVLLAAGKSVQWEATERFRLTVGNVHGTRVVLNGRDIPLPLTQNNVVRDFLVTRELVQ